MPKIQEMLDKIPTPASGATCMEKSGWLPLGFDDLCRDIMSVILKDHMSKYGQTDGDSAQSGDSDDNFDDDGDDMDQPVDDSSDIE